MGKNYSAFVSPSCGISQDFDGPTAEQKKTLQETHAAKLKEDSSNLLGRVKLKLASLSMRYLSFLSLDYISQCPHCAAVDFHSIIARDGSSLGILRNWIEEHRIETKFQCKTCSDHWTSEKHFNGGLYIFSVIAFPIHYPIMVLAVAPAIASSPLGAKIVELQKKIPIKYKIFAIVGLIMVIILSYFMLESDSRQDSLEGNLEKWRELKRSRQIERTSTPRNLNHISDDTRSEN
jgi:hypothetical protein